MAPIFSRNRQGLFLPHGKSASNKEKPTPFVWRGSLLVLFGSYRSLRVQVSSGKIMSSKSSPLAAKYCIIPHSSSLNDFICSIALFARSRKELPANFTNSLHIFVQPVKPSVFPILAQFSTSDCGNCRNHGESMGFPSLFPCSLYIFSLAFGMLPML